MDGLERVLAVFGIVTGSDIQLFATDMRRNYLKVAAFVQFLREEFDQFLAHDGTAGQPQRQTHAHARREGKEFHLFSNLAVVALLGLFQQDQIIVQQGFLREGDTVDTGQLLTFFIPAPIGSGNGGQLHRFDQFGVAQMRAAAKVGKGTIFIIRNGSVFQLADQLALVRISFLLEILQGIGLGDFDAFEVLLFAGQLQHLLLNCSQVGIRNLRAIQVHIIVESVFNGRSDTEFYTRIEGLEGLCHQVGGGVPEHPAPFFIVPLKKLDSSIFLNRTGQVIYGFIYLGSKYLGRQARADTHRNVIRGHALLEGLDTAIRKCNVNHIAYESLTINLQRYE